MSNDFSATTWAAALIAGAVFTATAATPVGHNPSLLWHDGLARRSWCGNAPAKENGR